MEVAPAQNEYDPLSRVAVKHPRDAFVSQARLAQQWRAHGFTAEPDFALACRQHDRFVDALAAHGAHVTLLPADDSTTIDSIYARDASLVMPAGIVLCAMGKAARAGEPEAQARAFAGAGASWATVA